MKSVGLISLGCDKNRIDSEIILARLQDAGYSITPNIEAADVIIVNTCAFIEAARKESIDTILQAAQYKTDAKRLIVTGCLGQYLGDELNRYLTEADCIMGCDYNSIVDIVNECVNSTTRCFHPAGQLRDVECGRRVLTTPPHYAYIKVADGCDNYCTYCSIPYIRGHFRSRPKESILEEARQLAQNGVKELILVAQDVTRYGIDLYKRYELVPLLNALCEIDGLKRIRLLYCYPELVTDELLQTIVKQEKIANYLDIPLQHVSASILKAMGRRGTRDDVLKLFDKLTTDYPQIALRSTFICGFPNETNQDFEQLKEFLSTYKLANVGFFAYSREKNTRAYALPNQVPAAVKKNRVKQLYELQSTISAENNARKVGEIYRVIVDGKDGDNVYVCRNEQQSPDIDGVTYCTTDQELKQGDIITIKITNYDEYDLYGELL